jgi:hypothetical protein
MVADFEALVKKTGGLSITREQKQLLLKELNKEIESTRKAFREKAGLPEEVFNALDAEYANFSTKLGDAAAKKVQDAIEGNIGAEAYSSLFEGDPSKVASFGEAKIKLDAKANELLTDVRAFHDAVVDGNVVQASSKLDDILDDRESLALMDNLAILTAAYGRRTEEVSNLRTQIAALRNLDRALKKQYMSLKGDDTIAMMFRARDLAKAYGEAAEGIEQRLDKNRNSNDDLNVNLGDIAMDPNVITRYDDRLKKYENIITVDFIKEIYLKNPALTPEAISNVDLDEVKEQIMEEVFATVKLDADMGQVEKQAQINASKAASREADELVDRYKATGQFIAGVVNLDPNAVIAAAERKAKKKIKEAEAAKAARIVAERERSKMEEERNKVVEGMRILGDQLSRERKTSADRLEISEAEFERVDNELDRLSVRHAEVGEIANRFDEAQQALEYLRPLRAKHANDDIDGTNKYSREEKDRIFREYEAAVKARFKAMDDLSDWKRRNPE